MMARLIVFLMVAALGACAAKPPQLGVVDRGLYYDAEERFTCPLPGAAEGFGPNMSIRDAEVRYRDETVHSELKFDNGRYVSVPVAAANQRRKVRDGYRPAQTVRFVDTRNPSARLEVSITLLPEPVKEDIRSNGLSASIYRERFEHGNLGLLGETQLMGKPPMRMGLAQFPYWPWKEGYMGVNLAAAYKAGYISIGPVEVEALVNFIVPGPNDGDLTHYHVQLSRDAREFLPATVDAGDVEAVYQALRHDEEVMREMSAMISAYLQRCTWMEAR